MGENVCRRELHRQNAHPYSCYLSLLALLREVSYIIGDGVDLITLSYHYNMSAA